MDEHHSEQRFADVENPAAREALGAYSSAAETLLAQVEGVARMREQDHGLGHAETAQAFNRFLDAAGGMMQEMGQSTRAAVAGFADQQREQESAEREEGGQ